MPAAIEKLIKEEPDITYGLYEDNPYYEDIIRDRYARKQKIKREFVIRRSSQKRGWLYIQDPSYSTKYMWTQFETNARMFQTREEAQEYILDHELHGTEAVCLGE